MNRVLIVVNPVAGRGKAVSVAPNLLKELSARGKTAETFFTTEASRNDALDAAILDSETVIALGGDGTLNRVARPIILNPKREGHVPAVAFIALGTGNVAARAFSLPQRLSEVAALVASGVTRKIDVGVVSQNGAAVGVFLLWLGAGLDGALIHAVAACRSRYRGSWLMPRYFLEAPRTLMTYRFPPMDVESQQINGSFASVMIANVGLLGVGSVTTRACPEDGQFNVIATAPRSRLSWCLAGLLAGIHGYDFCWGVCRSRETDVILTAKEPIPVQLDGEPFLSPPLSIKIRNAALSLIASNVSETVSRFPLCRGPRLRI